MGSTKHIRKGFVEKKAFGLGLEECKHIFQVQKVENRMPDGICQGMQV